MPTGPALARAGRHEYKRAAGRDYDARRENSHSSQIAGGTIGRMTSGGLSAGPVARWPVNRLRLYGGGAWVIAAGLAVGGTFAPMFELRLGRESAGVTAWGANGDDAGILFPDFGVTIVVGAVLVVIAAVLALTSTRLHPASTPVLAARLIGIGATGVVIGTTATLFL